MSSGSCRSVTIRSVRSNGFMMALDEDQGDAGGLSIFSSLFRATDDEAGAVREKVKGEGGKEKP